MNGSKQAVYCIVILFVFLVATGAWTTYSGQDANSLTTTDPKNQLFSDLSSWDLHLRAGSLAIDTGTSTDAPSVDFDGRQRPEGGGYDIGADEFTGPIDLPPNTPTVL